MSSRRLGEHTSKVEVTNVSAHGLWLLTDDRELFLPFDDFPWFRDAPIGKVLNVEEPTPGHFFWPDLDVDLGIESIEQPERFPLEAR
ncbi:MAG: DUF2442 domain-containing protein [Gemmatimonadetes bacterium]|jgi:hypothetical protein|nr:DUF2442 domain-containing protein [Gemmatimonadota bacterium]